MDNMSSWSSCAFELEDIEIIDHKTEDEEKLGKWHCDQCSLFFLDKGKLVDHKKKHSIQDVVKCKYCQKNISSGLVNKECYVNKKCETCEYKCSKCPQRFLRHSSLINHEKKHNSPKKKRSVNTLKKINCNATENVTVSKGFKRKLEASDVEERNREINLHESVKMKNNSKRKLNNRGKVTLDDQNIPKTSRRLSFKTNKSTEEDLLVKSPKRSTIKNSKCSEEKGFDKANKNTTTVNPQTVSTNPNLSTNENVVNYKPFSCHVCGDTFASDNVLLEHIRTHGENAAKNFKCKFCGDKFGDIYKMQYHLAICPLAEDELESSLKQVIPKNVLIKTSLNSSSPRKRGRPKKIVETTLDGDGEGSKNESTPPSPKRRYVRRRKSEVLESNGAVVHSFESPLTKQLKTFQNKDKELSCGINRNTLAKNNTDLTVADSVTDVYKESDQDDGKKKIHQCPFPRCDFKFTREKALLCHMRNHSDDFDDSLKCHKCDIPFDDIHALRQHINTCKGIKEEKDDDFHRKDACDVSPNRTFHRSRKEFVCNQCGRSHQSQEKLNSHNCQGAASNSMSVKFPCRLCGEPIHNHNLLKTHFQKYHPRNLQFQCPTCLQELDELDDVNAHMMEHLRCVYDCNICLTRFNSRSKLNNHYNFEHMKDDRSICLLCNKKFADASGLAKHRHVHTGERPYFCPFCYQTFNLKASQVNHIRRHTNFRPYKCHICPKECFNSGDLKKHIRLHTGEKPYQCDICKSQFRLKDVFNSHMKSHANIRPYKCFQCSKSFRTKALLRYHLPIHTGIRSFVCPVCSEKYYQITSLRGHIRNNHITQDLKCVICNVIKVHRFDLMAHLLSHGDITYSMIKKVPQHPGSHNAELVQKRKRIPKKTILDSSVKQQKKTMPMEPKRNKNKSNRRRRGNKKKAVKKQNQSQVVRYNSCIDQSNERYRNRNEGYSNKFGETLYKNCDIIEVEENIKTEIPFEEDVKKLSREIFDQCLLCSETFSSYDELINHIYIHI